MAAMKPCMDRNNKKGAVTKIAKTLFSLFSNEVRFKGVNLAPKEKVVRIC